MNIFTLWILYEMMKKGGGGGSAREPSWPSRSSPPPRRAKPAAHHAAAHHAAARHAPAGTADEHMHAEHHQAHAEQAPNAPAAHHDPDLRGLNVGPLAHAHQAPVHHAAAHHTAPVHHEVPPPDETPAAAQGYSIRELQRVLVALGWRGHLTTKGALSSDLTDGLYGPVTHDDWQQSARKRGLVDTFVRLGPETAQVDPDTYAQLRSVAAAKGGVVGISAGRMLRIP